MAQNIMRNRRVTNAEISKPTPRIYLSNELSNKCSVCQAYLSVGPVVISFNKPVCGRCPQDTNEVIPALFYENLAQFMYFPCKYDHYGCDMKSAWGDVLLHEENCKFAPIPCPAIKCDRLIGRKHMVGHFRIEHNNLLHHTNNFNVPTQYGSENEYINKLIFWSPTPYILKICFIHDSCFCCIQSLKEMGDEKLFYKLSVQGVNKRQRIKIKPVPVSLYKIKHHDTTTMTKIDVNEISRILTSDEMICAFNITVARNINGYPVKHLSEIECPLCANFLKPPILVCDKGHSICSSCKWSYRCPVCQTNMKGKRNIPLEKMMRQIDKPCRYAFQGCDFNGKLFDVSSHEYRCRFRSNNNAII